MRILLCYLLAFLSSTTIFAEQRLKVGVSLPLSGINASFGQAAERGVRLAIKNNIELNNQVEFIFDDNAYDATKSISSFRNLSDIKTVDIIYMWGSAPCLATAPLAEKKKLPLVCFAGDKKSQFNYTYGFVSPFSDYAQPITEIINAKNHSKVAVVYSEIPFLGSLAEALKEQDVQNILLTPIGFTPQNLDFRSQILKFKINQVDALVAFILPQNL